MRRTCILEVRKDDTFQGLIQAGKYAWIWEEDVTEKNFPVRARRKTGKRKIVLVPLGRRRDGEARRLSEVLAEAKKCGLKRPSHEDALRFGAQYQDLLQQPGADIAFPHQPVEMTTIDGRRFGFLCFYNDDETGLGIQLIDTKHIGLDRYRRLTYAFIAP